MPALFNLGIPWEQTWAEFNVGSTLTKGPFPITFSIFSKANLHVSVDGVELGQNKFSFSGTEAVGGFSSGEVLLSEFVQNVTVLIWRDVLPERTTDFSPSANIPITAIDTAFDQAMAIAQDLRRDVNRSLRTPVNETLTGLPAAADRAGGILAFDEDGDVDTSKTYARLVTDVAGAIDPTVLADVAATAEANVAIMTAGTAAFYATTFGYAATKTAAENATALLSAIATANVMTGGVADVIVPGIEAEVGALGALPATGTLRLNFEPGAILKAPGGAGQAASDITLMQVTTSFVAKGKAEFRNYRRVFDFDGVAADAVIDAEGFTFRNCGRVYNYAGGGTRLDFNAAFGCRVETGNTIKSLKIRNFRFEEDASGRVCDFGVVWRSGYQTAEVGGIVADGIGRMAVMMGDTSTWFKCKNLTLNAIVAMNIYPRVGVSAEYEVHGILAYGRRIIGSNLQVDTCYDLHASVHDSEGIYIKGVFVILNNVQIRNGGRGDAYLSLKGNTMSSAELDDPDALTSSTAPLAFAQLSGVTCQASPDFVTAYGVKTAIYTNASRVELNGFQINDQWDRGVSFWGYCRISQGTLRGTFNYGVIVDANSGDTEGPSFSDVTCEGKFGSAGFEYRVGGTSGTLAIPLVEWSDCRVTIREGTEAPAGCFNVRVDKSGGQNSIGRVRFKGCSAASTKTTSNCAGFAIDTASGSGANEGTITWAEFSDVSTDGTNNHVRLSGTAGKVANLIVRGGGSAALTSRQFSNPNLAGTCTISGVSGGATYSTERSANATLAAGATSVTVNMGYNTSRQDTILPNALSNLILTHGALGSATKIWMTLPGSPDSTVTVHVDVAPGVAVPIGIRSVCRYG